MHVTASSESVATVDNEAELQARLESKLRDVFPCLPSQIKMERSLSLRLGHHQVVLNGVPSQKVSIRGRYDALVCVDDVPMILAELKAPEVAIGEDDVNQALSYARLHDPMVPLVFVTNGNNSFLRNTFDNTDFDDSDFSADNLKDKLNAVAALAAATSEDAIRTLLGSSRESWATIFTSWSKEAIEALTGPVNDFRFPIPDSFSIQRNLVDDLERLISEGTKICVVHGQPLKGITNVLTQFTSRAVETPRLYVNSTSCPDVLQYIANRLSRELLIGVSKDDLRSWFNTGRQLLNVTIVLDRIPRDGFEELVEYAASELLTLVVGIDSEVHKKLSSVAGRMEQSLWGSISEELELEDFNDNEFRRALERLHNNFGAFFYNGSQHIQDLRSPRTLRVFVATLPPIPDEVQSDRALIMPPILGPFTLDACLRTFVSEASLKYDLRKLAEAFLKGAASHIDKADWLIGSWGRPSLSPDIAEEMLGNERIERMRVHGFLSWIDIFNVGPMLLVRIEEVLAYFVSEVWTEELTCHESDSDIASAINHLGKLSIVIPSGDLALARAIYKASQKKSEILDTAIKHLMEQEPVTTKFQEGTQLEVLNTDGVRIRLHFGEGMNEEAVGNLDPWIVLSHLASFPMKIMGHELTANALIFSNLGKYSHMIHRPKPCQLDRTQSIHFHDIDGLGSYPCLKHTGIVEPLLQSMLLHSIRFPTELVSLAQYAKENEHWHLAWRVSCVAYCLGESVEGEVRKASEDSLEILKGWIRKVIEHC